MRAGAICGPITPTPGCGAALYPKHLEFFAAGAAHREQLFMAANRVGKTEGVGGYARPRCICPAPIRRGGTCRRFERPVAAWVAV